MPANNELVISPSALGGVAAPIATRKELTIQDLWAILVRRRAIFFGILVAAITLAAIKFATTTRLYKGTAQIQVQKESADALSMNSVIGPETQPDAVDSNVTLLTQAQILQSDSLALQVVRELNLEGTPDFRSHFSPLGWVMGLLAPAGVPDAKGAPLDKSPSRQASVIQVFESHLKVAPVSGTRIITVEYLSSDPKTAAAVANRLVEDLIEYNFQTRHTATREASGWLADQLADLRRQSVVLQAKLTSLQRDSGVFAFGQTDSSGHEQVFTPALDRLQQATSQLEAAQAARIMKGALYAVVRSGDPELISGLAGNGMLSSASAGVNGSLALLQNMRSDEAQAQAKLNEMSTKFGPGYPKLAELASNLESIRQSIRAEAARVASRVKNDYDVAQRIEDKDRAIFLEQKGQAEAQNNKALQYQIARQEATQTRTLYETLVGRMKEADLVAGMRSSNITLVDAARVPAHPAKPSLMLYVAASLVGGIFLGICGALFRDATDTRIQELSEMEMLYAEASIGLLPFHSQKSDQRSEKKRLLEGKAGGWSAPIAGYPGGPSLRTTNATVAVTEPRAAYTESLRVLCTSLMQGNNGKPCGQVILVTSSVPGEGKSMLSSNLAIVYAQRGKKVLLVDGDLRTPVLHECLHLDSSAGLSSLLEMGVTSDMADISQKPFPRIPGLHVLPAGPLPDYPAELLASDDTGLLVRNWRRAYDYVIIDGAPVLPVTDSALLSRYADFTIVVGRHGVTDRRSLDRTCQILRSQGVNQLGLVLNGVKASGTAQFRYYGYNQLSYNGSDLHA